MGIRPGRASPFQRRRAQEIYDKLDSPSPGSSRKKRPRTWAAWPFSWPTGPRRAEGEQYSRRAVPIVEKLPPTFPTTPVCSDAGDFSPPVAWFSLIVSAVRTAERDYRRSLEIFEELVSEAPERSMTGITSPVAR